MKGPHTEKTKLLLSLKNKGKHASPATEFKKGNVPWNKGLKRRGLRYAYHNSSKTKFKPGHRPKNWLPVGTITVRIDNRNVKVRFIKLEESRRWEYFSRYVWRQTRGRDIPEGFIVYHMDGDSLNDDPRNLACVPRPIHINFLRIDIKDFESKRMKNCTRAVNRRWEEYRHEQATMIDASGGSD